MFSQRMAILFRKNIDQSSRIVVNAYLLICLFIYVTRCHRLWQHKREECGITSVVFEDLWRGAAWKSSAPFYSICLRPLFWKVWQAQPNLGLVDETPTQWDPERYLSNFSCNCFESNKPWPPPFEEVSTFLFVMGIKNGFTFESCSKYPSS